jgi:hypothetical protein
VLPPVTSCGICGSKIFDDFFQRDTGDFHSKCYDGLKTAGVRLKTSRGDDTPCLMCQRPIARGDVPVELIDTATAHLGCFFGTTNGRARSLGAAAANRSLDERGRSLRAQADALIDHSHSLLEALRAGRLLT